MKKLQTSWNDLQKILNMREELQQKYEESLAKYDKAVNKISQFIVEEGETLDVEFDERIPFISFKVMAPTIETAIQAYRQLRDDVTGDNRAAKDNEALNNEHKEMIGNWILGQTNELGVKSFNTNFGKAYRKKKIRASAADWDGFLKWAAKEGAGDAIQKRVNGSFVNTYNEAHDGQDPPFLNVTREYEIVVTK